MNENLRDTKSFSNSNSVLATCATESRESVLARVVPAGFS
jgi:hypothetical protein